MRHPLLVALSVVAVSTIALACGAPATGEGDGEPVGRSSAASTVGGCTCPASGSCSALTYSNIPADHVYYVTTFGGGTDTQPMACGGTADGKWAYVADESRFGCGAKLLVTANGKQCVAQVSDCGPNRCVEQAAASDGCTGNFPVLDASPFITQYLLGTMSSGWSDHAKVTATLVGAGSTVGCPGSAVTAPSDGGSDAGTPPADAAPVDAGGGEAQVDAGTDGPSAAPDAEADAGPEAAPDGGEVLSSSGGSPGGGSGGSSGSGTGGGSAAHGGATTPPDAAASNLADPFAGTSSGCSAAPGRTASPWGWLLGVVVVLGSRRARARGKRGPSSPALTPGGGGPPVAL